MRVLSQEGIHACTAAAHASPRFSRWSPCGAVDGAAVQRMCAAIMMPTRLRAWRPSSSSLSLPLPQVHVHSFCFMSFNQIWSSHWMHMPCHVTLVHHRSVHASRVTSIALAVLAPGNRQDRACFRAQNWAIVAHKLLFWLKTSFADDMNQQQATPM